MSREIRITPSILNADFSRLNEEIDSIAQVSDLLHLDVMDNVFVPNFTFDFDAASKIITASSLAVDAHLMVANVDDIAVKYAEIGCASVTIHAEAPHNSTNIEEHQVGRSTIEFGHQTQYFNRGLRPICRFG